MARNMECWRQGKEARERRGKAAFMTSASRRFSYSPRIAPCLPHNPSSNLSQRLSVKSSKRACQLLLVRLGDVSSQGTCS